MISNVERVPIRGPATATGEATWAKSGGAYVGAPTLKQMNSNFSFCQVCTCRTVELHVQQQLDATACLQVALCMILGMHLFCKCILKGSNVASCSHAHASAYTQPQKPLMSKKRHHFAHVIFSKDLMQSRHGNVCLNIYTSINVRGSIWILIDVIW